MIKIGDYNKIMSDRDIFSQIVYTPLAEALRLFEERRNDPALLKKVKKLLKGNLPDIFREKKCGLMARQLATPNFENRMFITLAKKNKLQPVFLEYFDDKFVANNKYKHSLGQLHIHCRLDKNGEECLKKINIIDFNKSNGKKIKDVKTLWGDRLIDFHKQLFSAYDLTGYSFFEETDWYEKNNETPMDFYVNFFLLVTCYGILFENFLAAKEDSEAAFTKEIVLPAIEKVINLTGVKPLIVTLEPFDLEADAFWYHHLPVVEKYIKLNNANE